MIILKPKAGTHCGDTFRELVDMWESMGLCEVKNSPDNYCWANAHGDILLYDWPRLDDRPIPSFRKGLFGNTVPKHPNCYSWIFWARSPKLLSSARDKKLLSYEERAIESIFLGKIENNIQLSNRKNQPWELADIEVFNCPVEKPGPMFYPYTIKEYLEKLGQSKFGLALPGYGPKCNREIELLGMGVVPLFTPGVDVSYYEPLVENVHYLKVNSPDDVRKVVTKTSKNQWEDIHNQGQEWYNNNASPIGSFEVTKNLVEMLKEK